MRFVLPIATALADYFRFQSITSFHLNDPFVQFNIIYVVSSLQEFNIVVHGRVRTCDGRDHRVTWGYTT